MGLTAANSMPVQTQQVQGAPSNITQRPSADILLRRKKKPVEDKDKNKMSAAPASAAILMKGKK